MELSYNGHQLHSLGSLTILGPLESFEPPDAPQRKAVTLRVRIDLFPGDYAVGERTLRDLRAALRVQQRQLVWRNPAALAGAGETYVNWPATVAAVDLPEDPNGWGTHHRQVTLTFAWVEALTDAEADNVGTASVATFRKTGATASVNLGHITGWEEGLVNQRSNALRSARTGAGGTVAVRGFIAGDHRLAQADRRTAMFALKASLEAAVDGADGTLRRGTVFNRVVRVESFRCVVDEAKYDLAWTLEASWSRLPDESNYETCSFTLTERTGRDSGTTGLAFSGTIAADTLARARTKLDQLRDAVLGQYGAVRSLVLGRTLTPSWISVADAPVTDTASLVTSKGFTEVRFEEELLVFNAPKGTGLSLRYDREIRVNRLTRDVTTAINGTLFGPDALLAAAQDRTAGNFLDALFTVFGHGTAREESRRISHEAAPPVNWTTGQAVTLPATAANALEFSAVFDAVLAGDEAILECECAEEIQYSGTRWVLQAIPDGPSVVQNCGTTEGGRTVTGSVKSSSKAAAEAWAWRKRKLLAAQSTSGAAGVTAFELAPKLTTTFAWQVLVDGVASQSREGGTTADNVKVYTTTFQFAETVPNLAVPA
jgi:hypothetical protein